MSQMRVTHVITGLEVGGAELMLLRLVTACDRTRFAHDVVSLTSRGPVAPMLEAQGVPVRALGMRRGGFDAGAPFRLARHLRLSGSDLVQSWMYHADLVAGLAGRLAGGVPTVWGLTTSNLEAGESSSMTRFARWLCIRLAGRLPRAIVSCAEASRQVHVALGYPAERIQVIPNGVDTAVFKPDPEARAALGEKLKLAPDTTIIGTVGRWDAQKDYGTLIAAAGQLCRQGSAADSHFVLCGQGLERRNEVLAGWIDAAGLAERISLLGPRQDVAQLVPGFDVMTLSSAYGEACPLAVLEAMACAVPCVVTDVGDSASLVGDTGRVVAPREAATLAAAWAALIEAGPEARRTLGAKARQRILENYRIEDIAARYAGLYQELAAS